MKSLIPIALLLAACGSRAVTGNEDDLRAAALAAVKPKTISAYELYFSNPLPALLGRLQGSTTKTRPTDDQLKKLGDLQDSQIANGGDFHDALLSLMATAKGSGCALLVADYEFDLDAVAQAMADAKGRGCDVRFVTDGTTVAKSDPSNAKFNEDYRKPFQILKDAGIAAHNDGDRGAIMHNKFAVVRGSQGNAVWTGSWNFTGDDETKFWNNGIALHSDDAADIYTEYFESLYVRLDENGNVGSRVKLKLPEGRTFNVGGIDFEVYFPSTDKASARIVEVLGSANKSVLILAFSFTSTPMSDKIVERVAAGVTVNGIIENSGACSGAFKTLTTLPAAQQARVNMLRWVYGPTNFLHHKVFVVDEETVVFGSFNFSAGADASNDENVLIVKDRDFARNFVDTYNLIEQVTTLTPQPDACN